MQDLTRHYLSGCSPYISTLVYDIDGRSLVLECVIDADSAVPHTRIVFADVKKFFQVTGSDEPNACMDSVIGMHWLADDLFCLRTEKYEITLGLGQNPRVEFVASG